MTKAGGNAGFLFLERCRAANSGIRTDLAFVPAKAGIQYAAAVG